MSNQIVKILTAFIVLLLVLSKYSCKQDHDDVKSTKAESGHNGLKYSLAQWSYNKELFSGEMDNFDFIKKAKEFDFEGVEFVSQFFQDKVKDTAFLDSLKNALVEHDIVPVMIMVDLAGDIGAVDAQDRRAAIDAHRDWIRASKHIGAKYTRVNAHGDKDSRKALAISTYSLQELANFAENIGITLLVENHGGHSSDADWLLQLINGVKSDNLKILADFDNWCLERENGELWGAPCTKWYDRYDGMDKILPYSEGLSLKSFKFDNAGNETKTDFAKMFDLIKKHNYQGYLGVEYEGESEKMTTDEGVLATRKLAEKVGR